MTSTATAQPVTIAGAAVAWADSAGDLAAELRKVDYDTGLTDDVRAALRDGCRAQREVLDRLTAIVEAEH